MSEHKAIVVLTAKSIERILREGGTCSWRLDRKHARQCAFAFCTRNANAREVEGTEAHHTAFLVGKVRDVIPSPHSDDEDRYLVQFSHYARVNIPDVWKGDRNPVRYSTLEELGIDPSTLKWEQMPKVADISDASSQPLPHRPAAPLTLAEAKKALALTFGVAPEAIEINIRG
jgi:hypothetical protein